MAKDASESVGRTAGFGPFRHFSSQAGDERPPPHARRISDHMPTPSLTLAGPLSASIHPERKHNSAPIPFGHDATHNEKTTPKRERLEKRIADASHSFA